MAWRDANDVRLEAWHGAVFTPRRGAVRTARRVSTAATAVCWGEAAEHEEPDAHDGGDEREQEADDMSLLPVGLIGDGGEKADRDDQIPERRNAEIAQALRRPCGPVAKTASNSSSGMLLA